MSNDIKQRQFELVQTISECAEELGWIIAIPQEGDGDELVAGLVMGTEEFVSIIVADAGLETEVIEFDSTPGTTIKKTTH